jgi:hypothetical protein
MVSPFDDALAHHALRAAADEYAARHGAHGTTAYRAAWLTFRARIKTDVDLLALRAATRSATTRPDGVVKDESHRDIGSHSGRPTRQHLAARALDGT